MVKPIHRVLPLLLFLSFILVGRCTPPDHLRAVTGGDSVLHPVVLLPGSTCSQLEARLTDAYEPPSPQCGARKGNRQWFRLWKNATAPQDPAAVPCLVDQLRLLYVPAACDYRNVPGVETRVLGFGSTRGFLADDPEDKDLCMGTLIEALDRAEYYDGETLFGAPYDFRQAPAAPGQPCRAFSRFCRRFKALVEHASRKNGGKPVVIMSHSQGGYLALEFLHRSPLAWRRRHVRHYIKASTGAGGFVRSMEVLASKCASPLNSGSAFTAMPSPKVFGRDTPLVVTRARNYSAHDIPEFLTAVGLPPLTVTLYETQALPVALHFRAPLVPTTCINGVGLPTMKRLEYWDGDFSEAPEIVYDDGDGLISLPSILALDTVIGEDPRQEYYKSVKLANTSHADVISDAVGACDQRDSTRRGCVSLWSNVMAYGF